MDKKGLFATWIFVSLMLIPILALLIMDYQVKVANDITGAYIGASPSVEGSIFAGAVLLGVCVFFLVSFIASRLKKSKFVSSMPLAQINKEIDKIHEHMQKK
ncbi:MAG: hypothetical protein V1729_05445 [Candidatus Woesearchaeota archaeon]